MGLVCVCVCRAAMKRHVLYCMSRCQLCPCIMGCRSFWSPFWSALLYENLTWLLTSPAAFTARVYSSIAVLPFGFVFDSFSRLVSFWKPPFKIAAINLKNTSFMFASFRQGNVSTFPALDFGRDTYTHNPHGRFLCSVYRAASAGNEYLF